MDHFYTKRRERLPVGLRTGAQQVINAEDFNPFDSLLQCTRDTTTNETTDPRYQELHGYGVAMRVEASFSRSRQEPTISSKICRNGRVIPH